MRIDVSIDYEPFDHKPDDRQYRDFSDRRGKPLSEVKILGSRVGGKTEELEFEQFAQKVAIAGHTWSPFLFNKCPETGKTRRRADLFAQCQLIGLDFDDNTSVEYLVKKSEESLLKPNLIYETFSSTEQTRKYRLVYILDQPQFNAFEVGLKIKKVLSIFPEADKVCKDMARLYFGSNKGIVLFNDQHTNEIVIDDQFREEQEQVTLAATERFKEESNGTGFVYGDIELQKELIKTLSEAQIEFIQRRLVYFVERIYAQNKNSKISRYELIFDAAEKLTGIKGLTGVNIENVLVNAIAQSPYFSDWGYDPLEVISAAMRWKTQRIDIASGFEFTYRNTEKNDILVK